MYENWLKERLVGAPHGTKGRLAEHMGLDGSKLSKTLKGERELSARELERAVDFFGAAPDEFKVAGTVPLIGYVGAGAEAHFTAAGELGRVAAPEGATPTTVAVEVRGESLGALFDRWLVYYDDVRSPITPDLIGRLCVVGLEDDRVLVKQIKASKVKGLYHLLSNTEGPILDVAIAWAASVKNMVPR